VPCEASNHGVGGYTTPEMLACLPALKLPDESTAMVALSMDHGPIVHGPRPYTALIRLTQINQRLETARP
jgi:hypothetical protein